MTPCIFSFFSFLYATMRTNDLIFKACFHHYMGRISEEIFTFFCPHHGIQELLQLQIFYNGLDGSLKVRLDGASSRAFRNNTYD
ncbi:hypothetical protein EPI10_005811 [Gossypium australe]|uniref:Uncharacterized protein n=1 Tax=Gossypium australe TaxID=47621 RepID=A0A5B6WP54_9ROSI|nr:hypothetical protein EPI10_005811 [Gossypium australe]